MQMGSKVTNNGTELILELLRQSRVIKTNLEKQDNKIQTNEIPESNRNPKTSLIGADMDGRLMLSMKDNDISQKKNDEYFMTVKKHMENILNRLTEKDYKMLYEEGFKAEDLTLESLSNALQIIKEYGKSDSYYDKAEKESGRITDDTIKKRMKEYNLPDTKDSLDKIKRALNLSEELPNIEKKDVLFLLKKDLPPTIKNMYMARYSRQNNDNAKKLSDSDWTELIPQVKDIISKAGLGANTEMLGDARWLIENDLPIKATSLKTLLGINELKNYDKHQILNKILKGMRDGILPEDINIFDNNEPQSKEVAGNMNLTALYQLAGIAPDEEQLDLLKETTQSIQELKNMPAYILGAALNDKGLQTLSDLLGIGENMQAKLDSDKEEYATLFVQPGSNNKDTENSAGTDLLLKELGLTDTIYNRRAINILNYNGIDITKENIEQVKTFDYRVNNLIQNLNSAVMVQLINDGINPLDISIDELDDYIDKLNKEHEDTSLDNYSEYLSRLEKENKITPSEKKAYMDIYRILFQAEKSGKEALDSVRNSGEEVTLNKLLTVVRYRNAKESMVKGGIGENVNQNSTGFEIQSSIIKQLLNDMTPDKLQKLHQDIKKDSADITESLNTLGDMSLEKLLDEIRNMQPQTGDETGYDENPDLNWNQVNGLMEKVHRDYDNEIEKAVREDQEITLNNLENLRTSETGKEQSADELTKEQQAKVTAAKRQLEEIRLKMTADAALRLEKKGFNIDTRPLQEVVEKLRIEEEIYYRELFSRAGIAADEEQIELLRTTNQSMQELRVMPAYVLGATLYDRGWQTVTGLLSTGSSILAEIEKAKEAYEPLLTQPKTDYGDSIQKAFRNMDSLMEELGIEDTVYNRRAIRILGYNSMEITNENIELVKAYDLKVNNLMQNLNPAVAVQLIKDGINPMDVSIDELNDLIEKLNLNGYQSPEKYSTYLHKLEKEGKITETERKAYIGIYRLLYQIEKSDGAALGSVIKSGREVTLNHLLTALKTKQKGKMDFKVEKDFGLLQDISFDKETIAEQIGAVFSGISDQEDPFYINQNNTEIYSSVIKQLLGTLTPGKLYQLHQKINDDTASLADGWDAIKNIPIEKLLDEINDMQPEANENQESYYEKLNEIREIYANCDQAIRFLSDFKLPCTTTNLLMAELILNNNDTIFKNFKKQLKKTEDLTDTLIDKKTMNEAYDELEKEVNKVIDEESKKEDIDSCKLKQLKSLGLQMKFIKTLAKREFYHIPVEVEGKVTNINLTIIRGQKDRGKVTVSLMSDKLGSIKAEATLKDDRINGYFICESSESLQLLQSQTDYFKTLLKNENLEVKQLNIFLKQSPEAIYGFRNTSEQANHDNPGTERTLYKVAKAILHVIKSAEEADLFSHKEVAEIK